MTIPEIRAALAKAATRIKYSAAAHKYTLDGKPVGNVTTICAQNHRPQLERWKIHQQARGTAIACVSNPIGADEDVEAYADRMLLEAKKLLEGERIAKEAASVGSQLHALIEWHCRAQVGEPTERPVATDHAEALFDQWLGWAKAEAFLVVAIEQPVCFQSHDMRYAGTLDLLAYVRDRLTVLDWKSKESGGKLWPDQRMQNIAYRYAVAYTLGHKSNDLPDGLIVVVPRDGSPAVPIAVDSDPADDFRAFESCFRLWSWAKTA